MPSAAFMTAGIALVVALFAAGPTEATADVPAPIAERQAETEEAGPSSSFLPVAAALVVWRLLARARLG